jgi:putative hydrolase of the HAD superfamily
VCRRRYRDSEDVLVREGALALMTDARDAGVPVGIFTNDMGAFHSDEWADALAVLRLADALVDGSHVGLLKPDPRMYEMIAARLGAALSDVVFLDDQPVNLAGAAAVGMIAVEVDVTMPDQAFAQARALLGLAPRPSGSSGAG